MRLLLLLALMLQCCPVQADSAPTVHPRVTFAVRPPRQTTARAPVTNHAWKLGLLGLAGLGFLIRKRL